MLSMAAFGETETGDSGQDSFVPPAGRFSSVEELKDKRIGVVTGSCFDAVATEQFPDAQLLYFNNMSDLLTALKSGKIDAYLYDEPVVIYIMGEDDGITYIPETLVSYDYAYAFPKTGSGSKLCDEMSAYLRQIKSDGTLDRLQKSQSRKPMTRGCGFSEKSALPGRR